MNNNGDIKFDADLEAVLKSLKQDRKRGYDSVTLEEFFYEFCSHSTGAKIISALKCDVNIFMSELELYLENIKQRSPCNNRKDDFTEDLENVIRTSISIAASTQSHRKLITLKDILFNSLIVTEELSKGSECFMYELFQQHQITKEKVIKLQDSEIFINLEPETVSQEESVNEGVSLDNILINMNKLSEKGKYDTLIGREKEVESVIQSLSRKKKNSPLLVGEPGVGKTAVVEGLVKRIVSGNVPNNIKDMVVYSLDIGAILSGTKYRGEFEKRLKKVLNKLSTDKNNVLFIDEIHMIIGAGAASGGNNDIANLMKPYLSSGDIKVVGATTFDEQRKIFDKDAALSRRFQVVAVNEPNLEDTIKIIKGSKSSYEKFHNVEYSDEILELAVKLSDRYLSNRKQPDKSFDILDESGAKVKLSGRKTVTSLDIEKVVANMANLPEKTVETDEKTKLRSLKMSLSEKVYGQDEAISSLTNAIIVAKAGLGGKGKNKPLGSFLFTGPTGVGKTEITKQLSETLGIKLLRYDMSEYMEKNSVSLLLGTSPGYVGFEQGGSLTNAVKKSPYSIVLFDEIEKAHRDINNILLQILDNGFIRDNTGNSIDFRNTIIIMTTNAGAEASKKNTIGMTTSLDSMSNSQREESIKKIFSPELRNRIDKIINFNDISDKVSYSIIERKLKELSIELIEQGINAQFSQKLKEYIKQKGFNKKEGLGARPLDRAINDIISLPLAEKILFEDLGNNVNVIIDISDDNEIIISEINVSEEDLNDMDLEEVI